jgi:hypothetical protein
MAAVQHGQRIACTSDHYFLLVRKSLQEYASQSIESGQPSRGVFALEELKRLDTLFRVGDHLHLLVDSGQASYDAATTQLSIDQQASLGVFAG